MLSPQLGVTAFHPFIGLFALTEMQQRWAKWNAQIHSIVLLISAGVETIFPSSLGQLAMGIQNIKVQFRKFNFHELK